MVLYALYRVGMRLALSFPVKISYSVAGLLASGFSRISAKDMGAVKRNLRVVLGPEADEGEVERAARGVFRNFAKYLVDFFRFTKIDEAYLRRFVRMEGFENIDAALSKGRGVVLLSAHVGNWELGGAALSLSGYPVSAVVLTHQDRKINGIFERQRKRVGIRPIEIGATLKACYRALKGNGLVALLGDRDFMKSGLPVEFFGRTALMPKGPAVFGYRQGSAIVPTFMVREKDDSFRLYCLRPIYADTSLGEEESVRDLARRYLKDVEDCIRRYPDQWYVFRELWGDGSERSLRPDTII